MKKEIQSTVGWEGMFRGSGICE